MGVPGTKNDAGKAPYRLLSLWALEPVVRVLGFGAGIYPEPMNWQKVRPTSRYFDATLRHLRDYQNGEANDPQSGFSHLAHACCDLIFCLWFERKGLLSPESLTEPDVQAPQPPDQPLGLQQQSAEYLKSALRPSKESGIDTTKYVLAPHEQELLLRLREQLRSLQAARSGSQGSEKDVAGRPALAPSASSSQPYPGAIYVDTANQPLRKDRSK